MFIISTAIDSEFSVLRIWSYYKNLCSKIDGGSASICVAIAGWSINIGKMATLASSFLTQSLKGSLRQFVLAFLTAEFAGQIGKFF